jgi:Acetyltransferase (isoleucine patch superfamily)
VCAGGGSKPIKIGNNVWVGDHALVCKGVTIGENSIVGAGAVVTRDIPPNIIAAGNPARVVKEIDPGREMITRKAIFANYKNTVTLLNKADYDLLKKNTIWKWMRYVLSPRVGD